MDNPRKKLYNSLITSTDPDVKEHFSQWSEDEFDKKLTEDKKFQKDLFLDLRDIGVAKDEATFTKDYLSPAPAPAPVAAKPVAEPGSGKTTGALAALDVATEGGPIGTVKNLAKAVYKGVSGIGTAAKQLIGVKSEDSKYEEAQKKSQAGSVSGFAGGDDLRILGEYENSAKDWKLKQGQKEEAGKSQMLYTGMGAPTYQPAPGFTPEQEKEYKKSQQNYGQVKEKANQVINNQVSKVVEKAKVDKSAFKTDKYGKSVPDPEWVMKEARSIATKGGAEIGGYAENHLRNTITAGLVQEKKASEVQKEFLKLNKGKTAAQEIQELFYKGVEPFSTFQDKYTNAVKNAEKIATEEYRPKIEAVTNEYKNAIATYKTNVANDPTIKQAVDQYDAQNIAKLQDGVNKGVLTVEQANALLTGKDSVDARNAFINTMVDEKHGKPLGEAYNKYLSDVSTLNNRYNARMRRQSEEQKNYFDNQYKKTIAAAKKNFNVPQYLLDKYERLYKQADEIVSKREGAYKGQSDINASIWDNFISSTMKGLGEGIQSTAYTLGMEDVASFGDLLAKNFETSDLTINSWNDVGFGKEGLTKFANSAGSILGRMGPGLAASAAIATATQGAGLGLIPSLFLTSVPSAAFETADIMGSIEQQVLAKGGDIVEAKKASERALQSQLMVAPLYALESLSFFPKFLKWAGKGKYAGLNIAKRAGAGFATNVVTETFQEVPQNVFEEAILDGKDPTFKELVERTTWDKIQNTSASVASLGLLMGAGPQIVDSSKDAIAKRAAAGYFANNILGQASHPALQAQNQTQFLTQLADEKGERFAAQMVNVLFQKGNIDKVKAEALANKLANFQNFKQTTLGKSDNPIVRQAGFILFDKYMESKNSKNEQAQESALAALNDYARTGNAELVMLQMPDGSFKVYNYDDLNSLMDDEDFQQASRESNEKYGAVFEITPLVQTQEGLQNPKLQQIIQRFDDIRNESPEDTEITDTETEDTTEVEAIDDQKILEGQKRSGFEVPKLFEIIPVEAAAVLDAVRSKEQGVTPDELSGASNAIYQLHKMYEKMRSSTTRNLTLDQIDDITGELEQAITELENQKTRLAIGDEQMDSLQQQDTESNQTIDTVTAPAQQAPQGAPVTAPGVVAEAPAAPQAAPEAAQAEAPTPAKPKAKVNVFTDEDVIDSFSQKESEIYDRLLFDGDEDLANLMIRDKRRQLVGKEVELLDVGQISEKVRQSFAKAGINIELLSADEFVQKLKEAGESASRTQEGVFDDRRGKIYVNKDAIGPGWGTTVVWHEAIHPIMNIIHNSNKALYDKIHKGILANAKANPEGQMAKVIEWVESKYNRPGDTDATRKDEIIVETLARLASGRMSFSELQPTLRQQFIDLINRIGRILGLSKAEVSDMKAIKDLAKKITETIKEGRDLSEIVGAENIGKYKRTEGISAQARAGATTSVKDIDVKNIRTLARPGNRVSKGLAIYSRNNQKIVEEAPDLSIEYVKENAPEIFISNANIISKFPIVSGIQKFGKISTVEEAQEVYDVFVREVADNLKFLMDEFNPEFRDVSTLWYDGANILAQNLAKQYSISTEQAAAMIASLSPQKDWYQNVRLAEMVMMAFDENPEMSKKMVDKQKLINIEGEKSDKSKIKKAEKEYETALANYSATPSKENRLAVKEAKDNVKKRKDALAKKIVVGKKLIEKLNSLVGKKMNNAPKDMKAYYARLWNEINTTKDYDVLRPDGVVIGPAYKLNGTKAKVAWGSYGEIGKAVAIYLDGSQENITRTLGEMHKIRNFNNNIIDPMSKDNDVTMDTHAIAAALLMALSGKSKQVTQNFGTGTSNSGALGIKGLYYAYAEAYILAAKEVGLLPRQVQSITWEAVRGLFTDTYKNNKENVKKINDIWSDYSNGKLSIDEARRAILKEAGGINDPTWSGPVSTESGIDIEQKGVGRGGDGTGRVSVGGDIGRGGKRAGVSGAQPSLGGRSEQAGDRGGRSEGRALTPLSGAPNVPGASGPDPGLVSVAEKYAKEKGIDLRRQAEYVELDEDRAVRLANAYEEMPHAPEDPKVKEAYADLIRQTKDQFNALSDAGYTFTFFDRDTDPYDAKPWRAMKDLRNNKTMAVYGTYDGYGTEGVTGAMIENNPMLEDTGLRWPDQKGVMHPVTANDLFRAVHDAFGHGLEGAGFRARGEENAWQAHVRLFTGPAVAAITSETRGQNSWLNYGPLGEKNRTADLENTDFALQKTGLMPEWTWTEGRAGDMEEPGMQASQGGRATGTILFDKEGNKLVGKGDEFQVEDLVSSMNHPIYAPIFEWYKNKNKTISAYGGRGNDAGLAWYNFNTKAIKLNINHSLAPEILGSQEKLDDIVAHEIIHSIVDDYIKKDEKAFNEFNAELSDLRDVLKDQDQTNLSDSLKESIEYIIGGNPEEMVTYAFTNPEIAAYFNSIKVSDRPGAKTVWNRIVEAVLKIVNQATSDRSLLNAVTETFNKYTETFTRTQASLGGRQAAPSFSELDEVLDMPPVKSRAAREKLVEQYGKETVDRMIEISRNFTKIINGLEEQGVVEKDCP